MSKDHAKSLIYDWVKKYAVDENGHDQYA